MASLQTLSRSFPGWVFFCCCCCLPLLLTSPLPLKGTSAAHHACRLRKINFQQPYIRNRTYTLAKMVQLSICSSWWDLRTYSSVGAVTSSLWHSSLFPLPFSRKEKLHLQLRQSLGMWSRSIACWLCSQGKLLPLLLLLSKGKAAPRTAQLLLFKQLLPKWEIVKYDIKFLSLLSPFGARSVHHSSCSQAKLSYSALLGQVSWLLLPWVDLPGCTPPSTSQQHCGPLWGRPPAASGLVTITTMTSHF